MAKIIVTKSGNLLKSVYNSQEGRFKWYTRNMVTGHNIALLKNNQSVETSILCKAEIMYTHDMFDTIDSGSGAVSITDNEILFTELEKFL